MGHRRIRTLVATVIAGGLAIWGPATPSSADDVPEVCGYVAAKVPAASVDTTILFPTTTSGQGTCTTPPCGDIDHLTPVSQPPAAAEVFVCVDDLP